MSKKFINIDNLKVMWDEINNRFIRTNDLADELKILNDVTFKSTSNIQLRPGGSWIVDNNFYTNFIDFVNTFCVKQYVLDTDDIIWDVICRTFFNKEINAFTGLILSSNDTDGDVHFWYLRIQESDGEYLLTWGEYIGELGSGDYVSLNRFLASYNQFKSAINNLTDRIKYLESIVGVSNDSTTEPDDDQENKTYHKIKCRIYDNNGNYITDSSVIDIKSIDKI